MEETPAHCPCGHDVRHPAVEVDLAFSFWGTFALVILGVTARPKKATWQCQQCGTVLRETRDPKELNALR